MSGRALGSYVSGGALAEVRCRWGADPQKASARVDSLLRTQHGRDAAAACPRTTIPRDGWRRDGKAQVSNQHIEGKVPANEASGAPGAPAGTPESLEQQLARERDARVLIRDRLRHTEALAAESHALRARMAQELERVTADRDRLRDAASNAPAVGPADAPSAAAVKSSAGIEPHFTPRMAPPMAPLSGDGPLKPPAPPARSGPWRALAMLGGLAAGVAGLAWITGTLPREPGPDVAAASAAMGSHAASTSTPAVATTRPSPAASTLALATGSAAPATTPPLPGGAVVLAPLTPEQRLAATPTAAGPAPASAPVPIPVPVLAAAPAPVAAPSPAHAPPASTAMAARLRTALDGEGIAAAVQVDASTGRVVVADPHADRASRDRTDLVIRAVYAGASLPEPQIEHRWLSPKRGERPVTAAAAPATIAKPAETSNLSAAAAYAARHAATEHRKTTAGSTVADAEELRPVLPEGRVTASCRTSLAGKSTLHRADMTTCMKHSCCSSSANHQAEDCRAYEKAYPFTCGAG